jgi:hypothetical protein
MPEGSPSLLTIAVTSTTEADACSNNAIVCRSSSAKQSQDSIVSEQAAGVTPIVKDKRTAPARTAKTPSRWKAPFIALASKFKKQLPRQIAGQLLGAIA